jgi:pimeloyl-ACP methyl ester carboxylesterase
LHGDIARLVLDQLEMFNTGDLDSPFTGRLDLGRVGVFGHSTGGGTAVEVCWHDPRCKAGLAMDAWLVPVSDEVVADGLEQPFLFMRSESWATAENDDLLGQVYGGLENGGYLLTIQGTTHYDFSDLPLLSPLASALGLKGPIDGRRVLRIINDYTLAFFDRHLKNQDASLLDASSPDHPEVLFESRGP